MRETQRQIEKYKAQLPHMRERVVASLLLLVVAAVTMVSASFAWIVLSSNPEVKGMNTTITSNGNLEIALANGTTITQPADSEVGDGGKDLALKNITWGNLINLGDPIYGLENIVLRPAKLNTNSLLESPLYAAGYGTDGRVDALESDFAFAAWDTATKTFLAQNVQYGVRTIASVTYEQAGKDEALAARVNAAESKMISAETNLKGIGQAKQIDDLGGLMQKYVQEKIDRKLSNAAEKLIEVNAQEIESIYELMGMLQGNMEMIADALAESYNLQLVLRGSNSYYEANKFTGEELLTAEWTAIEAKMNAKNDGGETAVVPANKEWLKTLRTKYKNLNADLAKIELLRGRSDVVWSNLTDTAEEDKKPELSPIINNVVNIASAKIEGTPLSGLGMSAMMGLLNKDVLHVEVQGGYLKDVDQFIGGEGFTSKTIRLKMTALGQTVTKNGIVTTYASNASNTAKHVLPEEFNTARSGAPNLKGTDPVAKDTFGMALDFFVRTNASNSHLILQGSPVYEEREETVIVTIDGKNYTLYTISKDENSTTAVLMGDTYYYYDQANDALGDKIATKSELSMGGGTATVLTETVKYVVGYSGVNRVWEDSESAMLDSTSTTQGAGSCYVFYPATPEDQEKSLQLLEHFRVAFVDQSGKLLATANMDVKNCFAETGKVTVPLVLPEDGNSIMGSDGEKIFTITELNQNEATFISALIYLDGVGLTNDQVLAAGEIQGQLNLQFGTTADLDAMDDPVLMESKCRVTAVMDGATSIAFDTATAAQLKKTITATVEGYAPSKVEGYFLREINSTQGIRQGKMTFQKNAEGKWVGEHTFSAPGKYILREIFLDGVAYELDQEPIVFTVEGFTITDIYCQDNGKTYMKTDKSFETSVSLTFASSDAKKMPTSVKGAFIHQETGNRTTVYFTRDTGSTWVGSATFTTSGEYRMDYLELDEQYFGLAEDHHVKINLYLGLSASVYADHTNFALEEGETREVNMSLIIKDDSGEHISNLANVWLYYSNNGSGLQDQGLSAKMVWDPSDQTYRGIFPINEDKAGIYNYDYVTIDQQGVTSTLSVAATAPTITAISTVIPKYLSKDGFGEVFALNNSAAFTVRMKNADSATLDAELKNEAGETYYVRGVMADEGDEQVFTFKLPIIEGVQSGTWSLQRLYMTNVYGGKDNALYDGSKENGPDTETEDKPLYTVADNYYIKWLEWTLADITNEGETQEPIIRVVSDVNVAFTNAKCNESKDFGKNDAGEVTATFGTTHPLENLELEITAGSEGKPLSTYGVEVKKIKLSYSYDPTSATNAGGTVTNPFGGYTMDSTSWTNLTSVVKTMYELLSADGTKYTIKANDNTNEISIAGRYKTDGKVEVTLEDQNGNEIVVQENIDTQNAPVYTVSSIAPTAKFTETDPKVGEKFDVQSGDNSTEKLSNSITENGLSATCYFKASSSGSGCSAVCGGYTASKVTVELVNSGKNFKSGSIVIISKGDASNITFNFKPTESGNPSDKQNVGSGGASAKYIGKDAKATQIILTDSNDISYTFDLPLEKQLSLTCTR